MARLITPSSPSGLDEVLADSGPRGVIARGLGRSYGDAAHNAGRDLVLTRLLNRLHDLDLAHGQVTIESGVRSTT